MMAACLEIFGLCFLHRKPSRVAGFSGFVDWYGLENDASSELDLAGLTIGSYCGDIERLLNRLPAPVSSAKPLPREETNGTVQPIRALYP